LEPDKLTFYAPMFEARYKSITQLIRECEASQVLELASGYSLRGLDLTQHGSLHYVGTDLRDVVATKLELLTDVRRRHDIAPNSFHVIAVADVLDLDQLRAAAAGFKRDQPLMVLCEGLVGYLTREEHVV
jgi:O-methyltransferase involved in polyketide biosynthesis